MKKKVNVSTAVLIAVCSAAMTFSITFSVFSKKFGINSSDLYSVLYETNNFVSSNFYEDIDEDELVNGVLSGYMSGLGDKYARYQTPSEYKTTVVSDSGHLIGIGVTVNLEENGYIKVNEISEESSAKEAGIQVDDIITAIDGKDVVETGYNESLNLIKSGDSNTDVVLTVKRNDEVMDISVKRIEMVVTTSSGQMLDNNIGYIKITHFNNTTAEQMNEVLNQLLDEGAESIIFDVRNNLGGMVSAVEKCIDPFLPEGDIAIATYHNGNTDVICHSDANELDIPLVILINGNSASGAELFSASLRDFGKAELVGVNSFGKGIMQTTHSLSNGGAVTFTIATYQTVKSECYHGVGLAPDYEVEQGENDNIEAIDPNVDCQLQKAIDVIMNK